MDVVKYQKEDRPLWILIVLLGSILGAVIYFFTERRKRIKESVNLLRHKNRNDIVVDGVHRMHDGVHVKICERRNWLAEHIVTVKRLGNIVRFLFQVSPYKSRATGSLATRRSCP